MFVAHFKFDNYDDTVSNQFLIRKIKLLCDQKIAFL